MTNHQPVTGGCACRLVRYSIAGQMGFSFHCQCRDCQYLTGAGHASAFICSRADVTVDGQLSRYSRRAPSGNTVESFFCGTCGSPVLNQNSGYTDKYFISAGTLDDPSRFTPTKVVHREDGNAWDLTDPET